MSSSSSIPFAVRNPYAKSTSSSSRTAAFAATARLSPSSEMERSESERPTLDNGGMKGANVGKRESDHGSSSKKLNTRAPLYVDLSDTSSTVTFDQSSQTNHLATTAFEEHHDKSIVDHAVLQPPSRASPEVKIPKQLHAEVIVVDKTPQRLLLPRKASHDTDTDVTGSLVPVTQMTIVAPLPPPPLLETMPCEVIHVVDTKIQSSRSTAAAAAAARPGAMSPSDSFDDGGIDWDEAGRVMDSMVAAANTAASHITSPSKQQLLNQQGTTATLHSSLQPSVTRAILSPNTTLPPLHGASSSSPSSPEPHSPPVAGPTSTPSDMEETNTSGACLATMVRALPTALRFDLKASNMDSVVRDDYTDALIRHAAVTEPLYNGWNLFPHQQTAILTSVRKRRQILALDMGLGKTLIGCCWARAFVRAYAQVSDEELKVVVVCPVSLQQEWQRTACEATGLTTQNGPSKPGRAKSILTILGENEENAGANIQPKRKRKGQSSRVQDGQVIIASWGKVPSDLGGSDKRYVVVADEAHSMQSMAAARTQDALKLMLSPNAVGVLLLTGTPMKNGKPSNLFPLLRAVQHPLGNDQRAFETYFCEGRIMQFGRRPPLWQASGAANLDQLRTLAQSHLLHMTKEKCLRDLPPQKRVVKDIPVSSQSQLRYTAALQELAKIYNVSKNSTNDHAVLGALQSLRKVDSLAKLDATVAMAQIILETEPAVVIFTSFVDVARRVHSRLESAGWSGELLTGETPSQKRQGLVDNFQSGLSSVFVCTYGAGGVGLTLTAACTVILLDRPWTPGDVHQAEDRIRRIGQTKPVTSIWMSAFELDKQIDSMIAAKSQTSSSVLSISAPQNNHEATSKLSILKLLQVLLPPQQLKVVGVTTNAVATSHGDSKALRQQSISGYYHSQGSENGDK